MSGPAKQGAFIFAEDVKALANFYQQVCALTMVHQRDDLVVLKTGRDTQLVISQSPTSIHSASNSTLARDSAIKLFFSVDDYQSAKQQIDTLNGHVFEPVIRSPFFNVVDVADCEGNVFHLRYVEPI